MPSRVIFEAGLLRKASSHGTNFASAAAGTIKLLHGSFEIINNTTQIQYQPTSHNGPIY